MPSKTAKKPAKTTKPAGRTAPTKPPASKKKPAPKPAAKPAPAKTTAVKPSKKPTSVAKPAKAAEKPVAKKEAPTSSSAKVASTAPATALKPAPISKPAPKPVAPKPAASKPAPAPKPPPPKPAPAKEAPAPPPSSANKAPAPKKPKVKSKIQMPVDPLFKPGSKWKPLIPSGPNATPTGLVGNHGSANDNGRPVIKTTLTKRELDQYRKILLQKRSELVGDIRHMEDEALRQSGSGSLSQTPQHMADQGSDTFEQSLSLDLAAVDRNLIREIDDALKRIDDGTYGMCERTGKPINLMRLSELPWARYSIEAARELERRPYQE